MSQKKQLLLSLFPPQVSYIVWNYLQIYKKTQFSEVFEFSCREQLSGSIPTTAILTLKALATQNQLLFHRCHPHHIATTSSRVQDVELCELI